MLSVAPGGTCMPFGVVSVMPSQRTRCTVPVISIRPFMVTEFCRAYHVSVLAVPIDVVDAAIGVNDVAVRVSNSLEEEL